MGKPKRFTNKQNPFAKRKRDAKEKEQEAPRREKPYEDLVRENAAFETYYQHQGVCAAEEWNCFMDTMRASLPVTFRITGSKSQAKILLKIIKNNFFAEYFRAINELKSEGCKIEEPKCLSWYPNEFAWQLELSRKDIRRSEPLFKLHNFLIAETSSGNISRQEAVSMIPPLVMDVKPHHKVLDMCAAPGSKTAQLIESLHADVSGLPSGFVLANDVDNNRCYMLVHQAKRLNSPCFMVTNVDSACFPSLKLAKADNAHEPLKFDRVLCDVPCSGDGTLRKNPDIWTKWNMDHASRLHGLQYRILKRGAELLEVGGKLVYSTCSLNPIENEAVLHSLLREAGGTLEIIDCSEKLPTLKFLKGLSYWEPASKDLKFYKSFDDVPETYRNTIRPGMFPPSKEEAEGFHLDRCIRILPHQQNTGGFFIALLEKKAPLPWESEATSQNAQTKPNSEPPSKKAKYHRGFKEDPFVFFEKDEEVFASIKDFYQLQDEFDPKNLLTRCKVGKKKNIYFCSPIVRNVVVNNEDRIKIINLGVKCFARCDNRNMECAFRVAQEGMLSINGFIGDIRRVPVTKDDIIQLLYCNDPTKPPEVTSLSAEVQSGLQNIASGSCILEYNKNADDQELKLTIVGWKGVKSLRAYIDQYDTVHILRLLGADVSRYEKNKFEDKRVLDTVTEPAEEIEGDSKADGAEVDD